MTQRTVVVSGGASGIGKAIVDAFADQGDRVYSIDINADRLAAQKSDQVIPLQADITKQEEVDQVVSQIIEESDTVDVLVNGAGVMDAFTPLDDINDALWDKVLDVNVNAVFRLTRGFINSFREQGHGKIINVASMASEQGPAGGTAYVTSKHAVLGFTRNVAALYANEGIHCNAIGPGGIKSNLNESYGKERHGRGFDIISSQYGVDFSYEGEPEDISGIALFLASKASDFINGEIIYARQDQFVNSGEWRN